MKKLLLSIALILLIGCQRPDSGSDSKRGDTPLCFSETDIDLFDENDYYNGNEGVIRPEVMDRDPLAIYQWHLYNVGQKSGSYKKAVNGWDLNVLDLYSEGITGRGVTIGIVDSGVDIRHPDLKPSLDLTKSFNYSTKTNDPSPIASSKACAHGTAAAGIAAARGFNGGIGVMGVAPEATIVGLNVGISCGFDATISQSANALKKDVDISSNSWGCPSNGLNCLSSLEEEAIKAGARDGRNGKGTIYLFAAGNEWKEKIDANYQSGTNIFEVITVGAMKANGEIASYSNRGSNLLISAFGGEDPYIVTTDMRWCNKGFSADGSQWMKHKLNSNGEYTHLMNGTSAATPMVAGVVALMLQANPNLTYRDVRYILATTARNDGWGDPNGAGLRFSHEYGFGLVDAKAAVEKARGFALLADLKTHKESETYNETINNWNSVHKFIQIPADVIDKAEYVSLTLKIDGTPPPKLRVVLRSPGGTKSILSDGEFSFPASFFKHGHTFGSNAFLDESVNGNWRVDISSNQQSTATLKEITLEIKGHQ